MIKTKKIKLSAKQLFILLIIRYIKTRWWLFAWIWILAILFALKDARESFDYFIIVFAIIYPIIIVIQFWRYVNSTDNKILLMERHYEIDNEKINGIIDTDTFSPIKLEHFIKVSLINNTYLLFIAKNQFVYIPIKSFESEEDLKWFRNNIVNKIDKNKKA